jgi:hypothetical protein
VQWRTGATCTVVAAAVAAAVSPHSGPSDTPPTSFLRCVCLWDRRCAQLRNPHGEIDLQSPPYYTFEWSPRSSLWGAKYDSPVVLRSLGYKNKGQYLSEVEEGYLWVTWVRRLCHTVLACPLVARQILYRPRKKSDGYFSCAFMCVAMTACVLRRRLCATLAAFAFVRSRFGASMTRQVRHLCARRSTMCFGEGGGCLGLLDASRCREFV